VKGEDTANLIAHMKKEAMATEAERLIQGTGWLPHVLRIPDLPHPASGREGDNSAEAIPAFLQQTALEDEVSLLSA
jgi:ParB family chromosome partitioning protein